jgi:hypothetical protein
VSFFKNRVYFYIALAIFTFIHHLFYSYFQRFATSADIYNFFTHIDETFETLIFMPHLFVLPTILFLTTMTILWLLKSIKIKSHYLTSWIKYSGLILLIYINLNSLMGLKIVDAVLNLSYQKEPHLSELKTPLYPIREGEKNIILIIGESMKYDNYVEQKLKKLGFFYKKIYAGATNTDVSLPLLINNKTDPLKLSTDNETNLFRLAKKNGYATAFISIQSENALHYIKTYLQLDFIDYYKSYNKHDRKPLFDLLLLDELKKIDFSKRNFIVLEQIGQHSPYHFFDGNITKNPSSNYRKSIDYSFKLYNKIYTFLKSTKRDFILIYTSDHGEFSGENGRFGHNSFDPLIYEVPMFITSSKKLQLNYKDIRCHYDLSQFLIYLLGYGKDFKLNDKEIIINGTMLSREDGYIKIGSDKKIYHFP